MAVVQGIKERVHLPIYDAVRVEPGEQLREQASGNILKFFVDVQQKTRLETNLQSASLLPHYNTFEARALRVVISDLPPEFSEEVNVSVQAFPLLEEEEESTEGEEGGEALDEPVTLNTDLRRLMELLAEARENESGDVEILILISEDDGTAEEVEEADDAVPAIVTIAGIEAALDELGRDAPPLEQIRPNNGAGNVISKFIYNTVTSLIVGEKQMISMPTFFFPSGAGPYSETGRFTTHGEPSPLATFRFAEPIQIDKQQNFRVEIEVPDNATFQEIQRIYGPLMIWVVLDGFMTRDVQ
jgi:hypothetical protein